MARNKQLWPDGNRFPDFDDTNAFARTAKKRPPGGVPKDANGVPLAAKLPVTSTSLVLPVNPSPGLTTPRIGAGGNVNTDYVEFINTTADLSYPRLINVWTETRREPAGEEITTTPFQMHCVWNAGGGKGGELWMTGSGGGLQLFVNAKSLRVDLANWSGTIRPHGFYLHSGWGLRADAGPSLHYAPDKPCSGRIQRFRNCALRPLRSRRVQQSGPTGEHCSFHP